MPHLDVPGASLNYETDGDISQPAILLIHAARGEVDAKTPEYLAAARGPVQDWEVPRGGHTAGIDTMPREYAQRVLAFLDGSLR